MELCKLNLNVTNEYSIIMNTGEENRKRNSVKLSLHYYCLLRGVQLHYELYNNIVKPAPPA